MRTRIVKITRQMPEWGSIRTAADVVESGGIVCFPTDTTYGFAANVYCKEAIDRLRAIKDRSPGDPFVVIVSDMGVVRELVTSVTPRHRDLIDAHWPGPLTIVFEASESVPAHIVGSDRTIALRIPNDTLTQSILRACGMPLVAPSANVRGRRPCLCPDEVLEHFSGKIGLLLDGGEIESTQPSTIVAVRARRFEVLRQGQVSVGKV
jgi:L-threonylcarbamoyladenylate synthase